MSSPGSFRIRDGTDTLLVRRGDVLQSTFEVGAIAADSTAVLNDEGQLKFYLVHFRVSTRVSGGPYTFLVSEADAVGNSIAPAVVIIDSETTPVTKTGSIGDWLSFEPILNSIANFRRMSFKVYTTRRIRFFGSRNYTQFGSLEYPTITYQGGPDHSGLALVRLGSVTTGVLTETFENPTTPFTRGGIPGERLVVILTQVDNNNKTVNVTLNPPASSVSNSAYSLGEINLVDPGQEVTFPEISANNVGNYSGTIYYVDEGTESIPLPSPDTSSSPSTAMYIPDLAVPSVRETFRLGDMNPAVDSLLVQSTNVDNRVVWIRRGLPVFP